MGTAARTTPGDMVSPRTGVIFYICVKKKELTIVCDVTGRSWDNEANGGERGGEDEEVKGGEHGDEPGGLGR